MIIRNVLRSGLSEHHLVAISLFDVRCPTATLLRKNLNGGKVKHIQFYKAYYRHFIKGYKNKKIIRTNDTYTFLFCCSLAIVIFLQAISISQNHFIPRHCLLKHHRIVSCYSYYDPFFLEAQSIFCGIGNSKLHVHFYMRFFLYGGAFCFSVC